MRRRGFFTFGLGIAALGGVAYWNRNPLARFVLTSLSNDVSATTAAKAGADVCVLTPEQTSGPYYIRSPIRSDITENRPGLPLKLAIEVVRVPDCTAMEGVTVEIWHCDAAGYYSGYGNATVRAPFNTLVDVIANSEDGHIPPVDSEIFMRGGQVTDANGMLVFDAIFPGWYDPRVTHIHLKVSRNGESFLTTQLYFPDELVSDIYANHPDYVAHGPCPYSLTNDSVLRDLGDQTGVVLDAERTGDRLTASVRFGTAVSGQLGREIARKLVSLPGGVPVIGLARTPSKVTDLGVEVRLGDYDRPEQLQTSLAGVNALVIVSGMAPPEDRIQQHRNVIVAARAAGVKKLVYTSILGPEDGTRFSPVVQSNRQTEADIKNSGLDWAIGRNDIYIEPDIEYLDCY